LPPFAASFFCNFRQIKGIWRKRVGVEPTIRPAKDRIAGFEGRGDHRTPFASASSIGEALETLKARGLASSCVADLAALRNKRCCLVGANERGDETVERWAGAHLVVAMLGCSANLSVGKQLARESFAKHQQIDGFA